jgi:hypothetical protein
LTWRRFFINNLLPVSVGNIIGGAVLVGAVYWFVYLRKATGPAGPAAAKVVAPTDSKRRGALTSVKDLERSAKARRRTAISVLGQQDRQEE